MTENTSLKATRLSDDAIRERIKEYCKLQDGSDLRDALALEERIIGLCEALGADPEMDFGKEMLEAVGIVALHVNPEWEF